MAEHRFNYGNSCGEKPTFHALFVTVHRDQEEAQYPFWMLYRKNWIDSNRMRRENLGLSRISFDWDLNQLVMPLWYDIQSLVRRRNRRAEYWDCQLDKARQIPDRRHASPTLQSHWSSSNRNRLIRRTDHHHFEHCSRWTIGWHQLAHRYFSWSNIRRRLEENGSFSNRHELALITCQSIGNTIEEQRKKRDSSREMPIWENETTLPTSNRRLIFDRRHMRTKIDFGRQLITAVEHMVTEWLS